MLNYSHLFIDYTCIIAPIYLKQQRQTTLINSFTPIEANNFLVENSNSILIDVRSKLEYSYIGHPLVATNIVWKDYPDWEVNKNFLAEVDALAKISTTEHQDRPILLMCRSGARSMDAALKLEEAGYTNLFNVDEGFEGDKDKHNHRSKVNGWKFHGLPWRQG
jgi:rhodanese-related sulfurtransferase